METKDHVLIVEGDRETRELLAIHLEKNGMRASMVGNHREMKRFLEQTPVDLIVLDRMLRGAHGQALCRELREGVWRRTPVILLVAPSEETQGIIGLELGADDYLIKPLVVRELLARIRSLLRRARMLPPNMEVTEAVQWLRFGDWKLDTSSRHLIDAHGNAVALSGAEYRLLRVFLNQPRRLLTRDQLLHLTRGEDVEHYDRSIDLQVSRLRQRLHDDARDPRYIKTLRREGYVFSSAIEMWEA
jgi:two-component system OmpR family response regulator